MGQIPIIATDADAAGEAAAQRHYWLLAAENLHPLVADLPTGTDPADLLASNTARSLWTALDEAQPLHDRLLDRALATHLGEDAVLQAIHLLASQPADTWKSSIGLIAERSGLPVSLVSVALSPIVRAWNASPRAAAYWELRATTARVHRPQHTAGPTPRPPNEHEILVHHHTRSRWRTR